MSFFKSILGAVAPIVGGIFGGPAGAALGTGLAGVLAPRPQPMQPFSMGRLPFQASSFAPMTVSSLGSLPQLGRAAGAIGGTVIAGGAAVLRSARSISRSANAYCSRHPAWCASIGGLPGVVGLLESGQLPVIRRRRGRGITPRDLRSFRRVANLVRGYCPTVRRIPSRALHVRRTGISHA